MFKSLFSKIMGSYILIPILILLALFIFLPQTLEDYLARMKKEELLKKGAEVNRLINLESNANTDQVLSSLAKVVDTNLLVVNEEGIIINRSRESMGFLRHRRNSPMMNHNNMKNMRMRMGQHRKMMRSNHGMFKKIIGLEEELERVLAGETVSFRGSSEVLEEPIIAVGMPIDSNSHSALFLVSPLVGLQDAIDNIKILTLQVVLGAIILALILGYFISRGITQPISQMKDKVKRITAGNFNTKIKELPDDELGELGDNFNYMSNQLEENISELATEKNRMKEMLTSMAEGVLGVTVDKEIMINNPILEEILNLTEIDLELNYNNLPQEIIKLIEDVLVTKEETQKEFEIEKKIITAQAAPVRKVDNQLWGVIILVRDVTEIRKLDQMRRLFVANVSHELKTPLTAIQGYLEGILDGVVESKELEREYLNRVLNETDRMSRLVADVLDLARLQSGQFEFELTKVNLVDVINSVYNNLESKLANRRVDFDLSDNLYVKADRDKLEEVIINLLSNAIKFTEKDGKIKINLTIRGQKVVVDIIDDGVGIPESELAHIWERFHQVDRSRNLDKFGTGLGLAIVKEIVEAMNGEVGVESTVGVGSKFSFSVDKYK